MKSEHEKMLAGELYNFMDEELRQLHLRAKALTRTYNMTQDNAEREQILQQLLAYKGVSSFIESPFLCSYGCHTYLGDYSYINFNCVILDSGEVHIGKHVMIGPAVQLYTAIHPLDVELRNAKWEQTKPIVIHDNVWIGGGAIILPGVTIGQNAVIGAGAVVTKDVPAEVVVGGNPAHIIKHLA